MKIKIKPEHIGYPAAFLYRRWINSLKFDVAGLENLTSLLNIGKPVMLSLWHNELFAMTGYGMLQGYSYVTMASDSKDGQYITEILEKIGYKVARGSSTRGGVKAMIGMAKIMQNEKRIGVITVDGPTGPRHEVKSGIIAIAQKMNAAIIPLRAILEKPIVFTKSWDRFEIPKPFSKCKIYFGKPFQVMEEKLTDNSALSESDRLTQIMKNLA
jgi:lysophospholipid acyltransferase (LPLAT)-like uncharacterized protein